tara:strand:+ start:13 stop:228 length:216 start_codon:yes stop_codon:yes gene_type:complete
VVRDSETTTNGIEALFGSTGVEFSSDSKVLIEATSSQAIKKEKENAFSNTIEKIIKNNLLEKIYFIIKLYL